MDGEVSRLLCIDLQVDPAHGLEPDARAVFGARQLLAIGRRLGWSIAHVRRHVSGPVEPSEAAEQAMVGIRPLATERVFMRHGRAVTDSPGLMSLLEMWREETIYVASFDNVALLSALVACFDQGPHLVLVEDAISSVSPYARTSMEAFRGVQSQLAVGSMSVAQILARLPVPPADLPVENRSRV
jgi:hypothetical protein